MSEELNNVAAEAPNQGKNMIACKSCGASIAKSAKACPSCGAKNKKPIYKRAWFIILMAIVVIAIIAIIAGGSDDTNPSDPAKASDNSKNSGVFTIGETVETEKASITLENVEKVPTEASWYEYGTVKEGNIVYKATFSYTNTTDADIYISESDFKLYADNVVCDTIWLLDENDVNQNIGAGRQATMNYTYQVPETVKELEFEYEGTFGFGSFKDITYKVIVE